MAKLISLWTMCCLLLACGNFERSNPFDATVEGSITDLNALLVGTWSRADVEKNQVYTFKEDGRVELRDYSAPGEGEIDRNGSYPETLVFSFSGTYVLVEIDCALALLRCGPTIHRARCLPARQGRSDIYRG